MKEPNALLNYLVSDRDFKIKQSESAEYVEPDLIFQLDHLYLDLHTKIQKAKINFGQLQEFRYRTQTQGGKIEYVRMVLEYFFKHSPKLMHQEDNSQIQCEDCKNYETYLQKLQNQIRQHIRLEQQLKLYQQSLEEKIEQQKKQGDKINKLKETIDQLRAKQTGYMDKISKLENQNEKLKQDFTKNMSGLMGQHSHRGVREISHTKSIKVLQMKQNVIRQKGSERKQQKKEQRKQSRKSIEKRPQSSQKWRNSNTNSIKQLPLAEKMVSEKNRQDRRKAIQAKFELRR